MVLAKNGQGKRPKPLKKSLSFKAAQKSSDSRHKKAHHRSVYVIREDDGLSQ